MLWKNVLRNRSTKPKEKPACEWDSILVLDFNKK